MTTVFGTYWIFPLIVTAVMEYSNGGIGAGAGEGVDGVGSEDDSNCSVDANLGVDALGEINGW